MKTIRWKFMSMFIAATTAILIVVPILFNIAIRIYFENSARDDLKNTFYTMRVLVERQLMDFVAGGEDQSSALTSLSAALTAARLSGNTEFYILDANFNVVFPTDPGAAAMDGALHESIVGYDFDGQPGSVVKTRTPAGTMFIAGLAFDELASGRLYIIFTQGTAGSGELIRAINLMLAAIMLLSAAAGVLYAVTSARAISRPIQKVCRYAKEIGDGNFITISADQTLTEIDALIDSINEMSARLKATDEAQNLFLQNASHELRTPLMSIQGYAEAIEKGVGIGPKQAAAIIKDESVRLTTLVEELITLSKIDNNIYDKDFISVDLADALAECVYRLNGLAYREHKTIVLEAAPGVVVSADENLLARAISSTSPSCA
jgi:signal transduction histidine kinase